MVFFFLRIRRPPRSTLFPYPTLSRSTPAGVRWKGVIGAPESVVGMAAQRPSSRAPARAFAVSITRPPPSATRSEEHTSELQSRQYLVCRLLLEKKKTA